MQAVVKAAHWPGLARLTRYRKGPHQIRPAPDRSLPAGSNTGPRHCRPAGLARRGQRYLAKDGSTRRHRDGRRCQGQHRADDDGRLSRRKAEYLIGIADEIASGRLDIASLADMPGEDVQKRLVAIRGVGAWTADNFRLFALADMDAWPVKDVALQEAMRILKSLDVRPTAEEMEILGEAWRPYRGAGALVLWHLYAIEVRKVTVADI